jgi:tetratricopeptide (TPR) repeat protein
LARLLPALGPAPPGRQDLARLQLAVQQAMTLVQPAGIALDDLHFADDATLEQLPALVAAGGHWLLALRGHEQPAALGRWMGQLDTAECIELGALDEAAVAELLDSLALPGMGAAAWAARVHRHSGGNPLFILETLRALLAADAPVGTALPLPDTLRRLVERRLAQLPPLALKLARVAALAGADFSVDLAAAVLELPHALDLLDAWRELEAAQVLHGRVFAHDVIFETVRDSLPAALRQWLHERIAGWLAAHDGAALRLAWHWRAAGVPGRAADAFEAAAREALAAGRLAEQARWLEAAAEAHGQAGQGAARFEALLARAIAAREAFAPEAALQAAEALFDAAVDDRQLAHAHLQVASCHNNSTRFDLALPEFEQAIVAATAAGDEQTAQHGRYLLAMASAHTLGLPEALRRLEPLLPWAEAQPDESLRHCFLSDLAIVCDQSDQRRRARGYFERALAYFDRMHETGNAAPTRTMFGRSLIVLGDLARARPLLEQAVRERGELSEGTGGPGIEALNLGRLYTELGRYAEALALLEPWLARLDQPGGEVVRGAMALVMARVHAHLGQAARALALMKLVPADTAFHQQATLRWTQALLQHDKPVERARLLDEALACYAGTDLPFLRLPIEFDRLACQPPADAVVRLRAGVAECERRELPAPQLLGRMRLVQVLLAQHDAATALLVARGVFAELADHNLPVGCYLPELYQACAGAAQAGGDTALARRCRDAAVQWIARVSQQHVPAPFRDSFAHRNPVNRAWLAATLSDAGNA